MPLLINRLLPDFSNAYPKMRLELIGQDELIDIVREGFDAGIRLGHIVEMDMVSTWLSEPKPVLAKAARLRGLRDQTLAPGDFAGRLPASTMARRGRVKSHRPPSSRLCRSGPAS
jgi:DNA-binding transcriptional LysR family regulator